MQNQLDVLEAMAGKIADGLFKTNGLKSRSRVEGRVVASIIGPDGAVKEIWRDNNLVVNYGDQYCAKKVAAASVTAMGYMQLGTSNTTAAKADTALGGLISNSWVAFTSGYPAYAATFDGTAGEWATFRTIWGAGTVTNTSIYEVDICDATSGGNMASRAVFASAINKGTNDTLQVDWGWKFLGA